MFMNFDLSAIILITLVVLLSGLSKSAFAGALGVFSVPLLMLKLPPTQAIALMLPLLIIADVLTVKSYWQQWHNKLLCSLIPGALLGILLAQWMINIISLAQLKKTIALLCILFSLKALLFSHAVPAILQRKFAAWLMSSLSGFSSSLIHAGGPPLIMYLTAISGSNGLSSRQFIATAGIFFAIMNIVKLIGFLSLGLLGLNDVLTAIAFIPVALLGNYIGVKIQQTLDIKRFLSIINLLLLVLGLWLWLT